VKDRPEPLARLDLLFEAARIAHEANFDLHGELAALGADDDSSRDLLRESAHIALALQRASQSIFAAEAGLPRHR